MSKKYLYGASVQGIQSFIMKTNDLKPIIGASELVDRICTSMFEEFTFSAKGCVENIVRAAGNVKVVFHEKDDCANAFKEFPRKVMLAAPGITISQAVVIFEDPDGYSAAVDELEQKLRAERNRPARPLYPGVIGMARSPKTGEPACTTLNGEYIDLATVRKLDVNADGKGNRQDYTGLVRKAFGRDVEELLVDNDRLAGENGWLAVVHIDGNGFGKIVQQHGKDRKLFPKISVSIDECTRDAFREAFGSVCGNEGEPYPIRPLVLSGDDVTFICRGDIAVPFVEKFLEEFERQTNSSHVIPGQFTACAGVAFMKPSYPFYYAYNLAESLCHAAKVDSDRAHSCLMFYKIQDSIISDWKVMAARELNYDGGSFMFGAYYLASEGGKSPVAGRWTIGELNDRVKVLAGNGNMKSALRRWVSAMYADAGKAMQLKERFCLVNPGLKEEFYKMADADSGRCPAYDILTMASISGKPVV